jgi:transcriptional regulator with XRE-family HTH domain
MEFILRYHGIFVNSLVYFFMPQPPKFNLKELDFDGKTIGQRIADVRKKRGITQIELAEKIGITQKLVSDYETDRLNISAKMLCHFAIALSTTADVLLGFNHSEQKNEELSLRYTRRIREISQLPEVKIKAILRTLDDLIRANS